MVARIVVTVVSVADFAVVVGTYRVVDVVAVYVVVVVSVVVDVVGSVVGVVDDDDDDDDDDGIGCGDRTTG